MRTLGTLAVMLAGAVIAQASPNGPTSVRYTVESAMTSTGVDAEASGQVQAYSKRVGSSDHHRLRVNATGLAPKTSYTLLAQTGSDPNFVAVANFKTGSRGAGRVVYLNSSVRSGAASRRSLPQALNPVSTVRAIAVADSDGHVVLTTDLHQAESMQFEITSVFENTGNDAAAIGCVAVACQGGGVQFRLFAAGDSSQFTFCVNGAPVETYQADVTGHIRVGLFPNSAPSPLDFFNLSLRNSADQVVLQSEVR